MTPADKLGAVSLANGDCHFRVWAPLIGKMDVHLVSPVEQYIPLEKDAGGYHTVIVSSLLPGSRYFYRLNGEKEYPDPASRFQPEGVHGPSQVINQDFQWEDQGWSGIPLENYVIYELHVGSYTARGTFQAVIPFLDGLKSLGITALEIMPVAQFPGKRNWGYDGTYPFAVQNSYGGPDGLKELVNACHHRGLAVILDVVYNHLGPEGNYFENYAPYFTDRYKTPWGKAINFDGPFTDEVRRFFIENSIAWLNEFHIDGLRLDALHAILDMSARPFLAELTAAVKKVKESTNRRIYLIGESDANDRRVILSAEEGGYGMDAQWNDDFHHALHALLTGESHGYYGDFGQIGHLVKAWREGFVYSGQYSAYRQRRYGSSSKDIAASKLVVFSQNHDQVGNRMLGDRLDRLVSFEKLKLAAGALLLSPFIPLIFMGQEYAELAPFPYFIDHSDASLIEAVRQGRQRQFAATVSRSEMPDPQDQATFLASRLDHNLKKGGRHKLLHELYQELLRTRRDIPALANLNKDNLEIIGYEKAKLIYIHRWFEDSQTIQVFNFSDHQSSMIFPVPPGKWRKRFDSAEKKWLGNGSLVAGRLVSPGEIPLSLEANSWAIFSTDSKEA